MKYRISTDYQQADGPPAWTFQDNIVLVAEEHRRQDEAFVDAAAPAPARSCAPPAPGWWSAPKTSTSRAWAGSHAPIRWNCRPDGCWSRCSGRILVRDHGHQRRRRRDLEGQRADRRARRHTALRGAQERRNARRLSPRQRTGAEARADERIEGRRRVVDEGARQRHPESGNRAWKSSGCATVTGSWSTTISSAAATRSSPPSRTMRADLDGAPASRRDARRRAAEPVSLPVGDPGPRRRHPRHLQLLHARRQVDQARAVRRGVGARR